VFDNTVHYSKYEVNYLQAVLTDARSFATKELMRMGLLY